MAFIMTRLKDGEGKIDPHYDSPKLVALGIKNQTRRLLKPGESLKSDDSGVKTLYLPSGKRKHYVGQVNAIKHQRSSPTVWWRCVDGEFHMAHDHIMPHLPSGERDLTQYDFAQSYFEDGWEDYLTSCGYKPLTRVIEGIRIEHLHDISEADAIEEGIASRDSIFDTPIFHNYLNDGIGYSNSYDSYRSLWERLHGAGSWEQNPQVVVYEFEKIEV